MYTSILILHILSAVITGGVSLLVLLAVYHPRFAWVRHDARATLYGLSAWLVFSGALLALLSPNVTALSVCDNLVLYFMFLAVPLVALQRVDTAPSNFDAVARNSLAGAAFLFISTLALAF